MIEPKSGSPENGNESFVNIKEIIFFLNDEFPRYRRLLYVASLARILILLSVWAFVVFVLFHSHQIVVGSVVVILLYFYSVLDTVSTMKRAKEDNETVKSLKIESDSDNEPNTRVY